MHNESTSTVVGTLTDAITAEILAGKLAAGAALRQDLLARRFGVSRTPVREALYRLVANGLATFQPNLGFRVRSFLGIEYLEALMIRSRLEAVAAERATVRITCQQLNELVTANRAMHALSEEILKGGRDFHGLQQAWTRENSRFHGLLLAAADIPKLTEMVARVVTFFPREVLDAVAAHRRPELLHEYEDDHMKIYTAIEQGNPAEARTQARLHVERALRHVRDVFELGMEAVAADVHIAGAR